MSNIKPLKLDMSFRQALEMIAKGGKPPTGIPKPKATVKAKAKPAKKATKKKKG